MTPNTVNKAPRFQLSIDVKTLYERLLASATGDTIDYRELSGLIGRDVTGKARSVLYSARKRAERENRIVFGAVHSVGIKRLSDIEIVDSGHQILRHVRRSSQRGFTRLTATVDFNKLPEPARVQHNAFASVLGAVAGALHEKKLKRIEEKVKETQKALPLADTLKAFIS